jgi:ABC-type uncharacterized transport system permease subunit
MVKRISSIALKGIALATGVAVIVLSTLDSLAIGSAITLLGIGLAALALESMQREKPETVRKY